MIKITAPIITELGIFLNYFPHNAPTWNSSNFWMIVVIR